MRFPPSHYLENNVVSQLAARFEKHRSFQNQDIKILTQYHPVNHLKLMGVDMKQCYDDIMTSRCDSFENVVIAIIPGDCQVLVSVVVEQTDDHSIQESVAQLNDILKTIYHVSSDPMKNGFISITGLLVCPNIDQNKFNATACFSKDYLKSELFFLKDDWDNNDSFKRKLEKILHNMSKEMKQIRPVKFKSMESVLEGFCGELMASMAQTTLYLPKVTDDVTTKIDTVLLTGEQIDIINSPANWKVIKGPFGSGKSIILHEVVRKLLKEESQSSIYYISFDPYSLVDVKFQESFDSLCIEENMEHLKPRIKAMSIGDALSDCQHVSIEDVYSLTQPPEKNLTVVLEHLLRKESNLDNGVTEVQENTQKGYD